MNIPMDADDTGIGVQIFNSVCKDLLNCTLHVYNFVGKVESLTWTAIERQPLTTDSLKNPGSITYQEQP